MITYDHDIHDQEKINKNQMNGTGYPIIIFRGITWSRHPPGHQQGPLPFTGFPLLMLTLTAGHIVWMHGSCMGPIWQLISYAKYQHTVTSHLAHPGFKSCRIFSNNHVRICKPRSQTNIICGQDVLRSLIGSLV